MLSKRIPSLLNTLVLLGVTAGFSFPAAGAQCSAQSDTRTAALVELYTSEGCSSCPPADRWLSSLQSNGYGPGKVVPLALHVDYWDYIGWKDPYAKPEFTKRQRRQADLRRAKIVYTPQVLLQGRDFRHWSAREFGEAVARTNALPARAKLALGMEAIGKSGIDVSLSAELLNPADLKAAAVYLAVYENKLSSRVSAGENQGKTLPHDYVVREWIGPLEFDAGLKVAKKRVLPLRPNADPKQSGVAAFVQNQASGEVLQALMLGPCDG